MKTKSIKSQLISCFYQGNIALYIIIMLCTLVCGTLNVFLSWIMQQLLDTASGTEGARSLAELTKLSAGLVLLCIVCFLIDFLAKPKFYRRAMEQYKNFAFKKLTEKSISSFGDQNTAVYISALSNDATSIESEYLTKQFTIVQQVVAFFGSILLMLLYSPLMTVIAIVLTALPFAASMLTGNKLESIEHKVSDQNAGFVATLSDCLSGFSVVKSFKAEREIFRLFAQSNAKLEGKKFDKQRIKILVGMIGSVTAIMAQLGVFLVGTYLALTDKGLTPGVVLAFVNLMNFVIQPIAELPGMLAGRKASIGLIEKLGYALEESPVNSGTAVLSGVSSGICFDNVSFGYDKSNPVLHNISAEFVAGKAYAIVGGSGSGKSTLLGLLTAANTGYSGSIKFDGTELKDICSESLYNTISVIQQNVFVFNASIHDNVTMFRDFPKNEVDSAVLHAHLSELIEKRGADYLCGENGKGLSGGEKQRISIARSLLKKSSVLLADEITAALDAQTAHRVSSDILSIDGITRIVITHALDETLLRRYDGILVMKNGRIENAAPLMTLWQKKAISMHFIPSDKMATALFYTAKNRCTNISLCGGFLCFCSVCCAQNCRSMR